MDEYKIITNRDIEREIGRINEQIFLSGGKVVSRR